ncbi:MAG: AAA family ATPase, partial [Actinomycetota bacterium]|nr:AAA family ATPase [Actinomycetota bacterium]
MSTHPVYVISGVAGSGKTTLAHAWAPTMGAAVVDLDVVAANVVDAALHEHPEATPWQINAAYRAQRYQCLIDAITTERQSATVMAVAPFTQEISGEAPWLQFVRDIGGEP